MWFYLIGDLQVDVRTGMKKTKIPGTVKQLLVPFHTNLIPQNIDQLYMILYSLLSATCYRTSSCMIGGIKQISLSETNDQTIQLREGRKDLVDLYPDQLLCQGLVDIGDQPATYHTHVTGSRIITDYLIFVFFQNNSR